MKETKLAHVVFFFSPSDTLKAMSLLCVRTTPLILAYLLIDFVPMGILLSLEFFLLNHFNQAVNILFHILS